MKLFRFTWFISLLLFTCTLLVGQSNTEIKKSSAALISDSIYELFVEKGFNPEKQLLDNTFSENFPYNIIVRLDTVIEEIDQIEKKLVIVFLQQDAPLFLKECTIFINNLKTRVFPYSLELVFTANDKTIVPPNSSYPFHVPEGTTTYIHNLETTENTAVIIVASDSTIPMDASILTTITTPMDDTTAQSPNFTLFDKIVEIIPGGISSSGKSLIVSSGFFKTLINSFDDADVAYFIRGQFLALYRLRMIQHDPIVSTWLESDIPAVLLNLTPENNEDIFKTLDAFLNQYVHSDISNQDTNYSLLQLFSRSFLIPEQFYIIFLILSSAVLLFGFYNLSFTRGVHKYIHREEFFKNWYLLPFILVLTSLFLFASQYFVQILIPDELDLPLFSFIVKTSLAILLLLLVSSIQHLTKLPITGFLYGYLLLVSAFINIFIFAAVEITLIPIFIVEYLIVFFSRTIRRIVPLILCTLLMAVPFIPFVIALSNSNYAFTVEFITHANFLINLLFACILLPFQFMIIRIFIRLKLWGKRRKVTTRQLIIQSLIVFATIILVCLVLFFVPQIILHTQKTDNFLEQPQSAFDNSIQIDTSKSTRLGQNLNTLVISSKQPALRYYIEISSNTPLPIFDANYPYDILQKPFTAVFPLDEHPPEPFILNFTTQDAQDTLCTITAWVQTDEGIQKEQVQQTIFRKNE